jgi:hypothetical protein
MIIPDDIPLIPEPSEEYLNQRQYHDYAAHREAFLEWLTAFGKNPAKAEGYALATVENTAYRADKVYRWVWERHDGYTTNITHDHADDYREQNELQSAATVHRALVEGLDDNMEHVDGAYDHFAESFQSALNEYVDCLANADLTTEERTAALEFLQDRAASGTPHLRDRFRKAANELANQLNTEQR